MRGLAGLSVIAFASLNLSVPARAQENCKPVQFARGQSSATIHGTAPPEDTICSSFAARVGQTARLRITGNNMIISVIDVGDARDSWTFTTKAQTYKFVVGQLMRSVSPEPYTVALSIR